jgi:hypothetical protein
MGDAPKQSGHVFGLAASHVDRVHQSQAMNLLAADSSRRGAIRYPQFSWIQGGGGSGASECGLQHTALG